MPDAVVDAKTLEGTVVAVGPGARNADGVVFPVSVEVRLGTLGLTTRASSER